MVPYGAEDSQLHWREAKNSNDPLRREPTMFKAQIHDLYCGVPIPRTQAGKLGEVPPTVATQRMYC
jgi:hypothetical protein